MEKRVASKPDDPREENQWVAFARYAGVGLEVAAAVVISIYVGYRIDAWLGRSPVFLIICLVIGFAVAINVLIKYSRLAAQDMKGGEKDETER
jgi:F0F1-type ATP synthase assembly protein I